MAADTWPRDGSGNIRMVLYVAGPMTGLPEFNRPQFHAVTDELRRRGYYVLNPARQPLGLEYNDYMRRGLYDVSRADGLALLPNWEESNGARIEHRLALKMGLECRPHDEWENLYEKEPQL
ncbi:nucleoside deoxyribosyltransferase [Arthrobacter phage Chubster]|uniref:Nucleoside deoxyribosyltransferase n=1 Tax=Arthrobacter phage Chubster TaxID=1897527 RepID=A0A1I9SCR6_9CAUD|nr:nucleoside deoxyribosyltransferase [Arthrobacter phage Chubster]